MPCICVFRDIKLWDVIVNASHVHPDDIQKEVVFIGNVTYL